MQTTPTSSTTEQDSNKTWHRFKQEPLLIFMAIALLIFVGDYLLSLTKDDPKAIVITPEIRQEAKQIYINSLKQEPSEKDMKINRGIEHAEYHKQKDVRKKFAAGGAAKVRLGQATPDGKPKR